MTIVPITNTIGISSPTAINSIAIIKNISKIAGQNNQIKHCSQGFHLGLSVNSSVMLYPSIV